MDDKYIPGTLSDRELWACANQVLQQHGDDARSFAKSRIITLALAGDERGVSTWQAIWVRIDQLSGNGQARQ